MRTYEPQVVVTYDENGFYGHPDHIQANRVTHAAIAECGHPGQAVLHGHGPLAAARASATMLAEAGIERPAEVQENPDFGTPDELITTTVDCSAVAGRKYASLAAHASQSDNIFFLQMGEELFSPHHGLGELRAGARLDRGAGARGRPLRRAPLTTGREPEPGLRPTGREGTQGPVRCGPYVAVPAGVVPARARGTDPTRHSAAAATSTTAASISIVKASLAKGASHESLKPKSPTATESRKPAMVVRAKPEPDDGRPEPADGHHADADDQPGDRLQQEERADGGDGAVAVGLVPEVEVDVGRPDQEHAADDEGGRGGQVHGPAGAAGADAPGGSGACAYEASGGGPGRRMSALAGGHDEEYGPGPARDWPDRGESPVRARP